MIKQTFIGATLAVAIMFIGSQITGSWDAYYEKKEQEKLSEIAERPYVGPVDKCNFSEPIPPYKGLCTWAGQPVR